MLDYEALFCFSDFIRFFVADLFIIIVANITSKREFAINFF